ncbi:putative type II secretion system protein F [compost metagenome]
MAKYCIRGVTPAGSLVEQSYVASSPQDASRMAREAGVIVISVHASERWSWQSRSASRFDLGLLTQELIALLRAGLSLIEALEALVERENASSFDQMLLTAIIERVREGRPFSAALSSFPQTFPELFIGSVAASEHTGDLIEALERYLRYHQQVAQVRQKLISASLYPLLLMAAGGAVALFLLCYLVPKFSQVYSDIDSSLPPLSRWLMLWGRWANENLVLCISTSVFCIAFGVWLAWHPNTRRWLMGAIARNNLIGPRLRLAQLSRFYRALGLLLSGGVPLVKAMTMTHALLPPNLHHALAGAVMHIEQGKCLSDSLMRSGLATSVALRLLRVGERNGQLSEMLEQIALFHDGEMAQWIERFSRLVEPLLMIFIGLLIGGIVILLYLPIFDMAGSLQ